MILWGVMGDGADRGGRFRGGTGCIGHAHGDGGVQAPCKGDHARLVTSASAVRALWQLTWSEQDSLGSLAREDVMVTLCSGS